MMNRSITCLHEHTIPGDDFNQLRFHLQHLLPSDSRLLFTDESPVLGVEVGEEPRRDS